jgi:hypothetical protein
MPSESYELKLAKLNSELLLKTKAYYQVLKEDKCFEEIEKLRLEIKRLEKQLEELLKEKKQS